MAKEEVTYKAAMEIMSSKLKEEKWELSALEEEPTIIEKEVVSIDKPIPPDLPTAEGTLLTLDHCDVTSCARKTLGSVNIGFGPIIPLPERDDNKHWNGKEAAKRRVTITNTCGCKLSDVVAEVWSSGAAYAVIMTGMNPSLKTSWPKLDVNKTVSFNLYMKGKYTEGGQAYIGIRLTADVIPRAEKSRTTLVQILPDID